MKLTNKQAFAVATQVFKALGTRKLVAKKDRVTNKEIKQVIYDAVKSVDIAGVDTDGNDEKELNRFKLSQQLRSDSVYARDWMIDELARSVASTGNAAAAKELRDILSIMSQDKDLIVHHIDHSKVCPYCSSNEA